MKITEENISGLLKSGNEKAYAFIYDNYYKQLVAYSKKIVRDTDTANEIVQQLITNLWRVRENLDISRPILPYLYKSAYNNCNKHLRDNKLTINNYDEMLGTEDISCQPDHANYTELLEVVQDAIKTLTEQQQEIFQLSRFQGFKNREVAEKLNISEKTVEYHMRLVICQLRDRLKPSLLK